MNNRYFTVISIFFLLLLTSCTKENLEDCFGGLKLRFSFTLHTEEGDRFPQNTEVVRVYCFNTDSVLCHVQESLVSNLTDRCVMDVELAPGKYYTVAWAGSSSDLSECYTLLNTEIGKSTMADFRLQMKGDVLTEDPDFISPERSDLDDLYYGAFGERHALSSLYMMKTMEVKANEFSEYPVDLIRYTNLLRVTISGIENWKGGNDFKVWSTAQNGEYSILNNNLIDENSLPTKHAPFQIMKDANTYEAEFKLLRLMEDNQPSPIRLYIETPSGTQLLGAPLNVIETLLQARNINTGEYVYKSQSDFDRIYEHHIRIVIGSDLEVKIFIGEWEIVEIIPVS